MTFPFLTLVRNETINGYTFGELYIGTKKFCDTAEDACEYKISIGKYDISLNECSYEMSKDMLYKNVCKGFVPCLKLDTALLDGYLTYRKKDIGSGSIQVGRKIEKDNKAVLTDSASIWMDLYEQLKIASKQGQRLDIEIR